MTHQMLANITKENKAAGCNSIAPIEYISAVYLDVYILILEIPNSNDSSPRTIEVLRKRHTV